MDAAWPYKCEQQSDQNGHLCRFTGWIRRLRSMNIFLLRWPFFLDGPFKICYWLYENPLLYETL
ncbi:hypothetical protein CS542_02825 [Pedobacter sp. IW39]|nr:hypothetical protein CS542_02825 [Pedobacter sp. IW39]